MIQRNVPAILAANIDLNHGDLGFQLTQNPSFAAEVNESPVRNMA